MRASLVVSLDAAWDCAFVTYSRRPRDCPRHRDSQWYSELALRIPSRHCARTHVITSMCSVRCTPDGGTAGAAATVARAAGLPASNASSCLGAPHSCRVETNCCHGVCVTGHIWVMPFVMLEYWRRTAHRYDRTACSRCAHAAALEARYLRPVE